jgi:hypothetical protein
VDGTRPRGGSKKKARARPGGGCLSTWGSSTRVYDAWVRGPRGSDEAVLGHAEIKGIE